MSENINFLRNALDGLSISGYELENENIFPYFSNHLRTLSEDACKWLVDDEDDSNEKILFANCYEKILSENGFNDILTELFERKFFGLASNEKQAKLAFIERMPKEISKYYAAFVLTLIEQFIFSLDEDENISAAPILEIHLAFNKINSIQPTNSKKAKNAAKAKFEKHYGEKKRLIHNWYNENQDGTKSMDSMAEMAAKKFNMPFKTARKWIGDYKKEAKLQEMLGGKL